MLFKPASTAGSGQQPSEDTAVTESLICAVAGQGNVFAALVHQIEPVQPLSRLRVRFQLPQKLWDVDFPEGLPVPIALLSQIQILVEQIRRRGQNGHLLHPQMRAAQAAHRSDHLVELARLHLADLSKFQH